MILRARPFSLMLYPRPLKVLGVLIIALVLGAFVALLLGSESIPARLALGWLGIGPDHVSDYQALILGAFRWPRILLALCCGAMLGLAGQVMQSMTRNGLADPGLLGVREGTALAVLALLLLAPQVPTPWRPLAGMAGGLAAGLTTLALSRGQTGLRFVLTGLGVSWCLAALLVVLLTLTDTEKLQGAMIWLSGTLQAADMAQVHLALMMLFPCLAGLLWLSPSGEIEALGPEMAIALGVRRRSVAVLRFLAAILLTAGAVSLVGRLGFVGLVAPHLAHALPRESPRVTLLASGFLGALLVLGADTAARRLLAPTELPVGIVMAAIGAPLLMLLLLRRRA